MKKSLVILSSLLISFGAFAQTNKTKPSTPVQTKPAQVNAEVKFKSASTPTSSKFFKTLTDAILENANAEMDKEALNSITASNEKLETQSDLNTITIKFLSSLPSSLYKPEKVEFINGLNDKIGTMESPADYNKLLLEIESSFNSNIFSDQWNKKARASWIAEIAKYK